MLIFFIMNGRGGCGELHRLWKHLSFIKPLHSHPLALELGGRVTLRFG
jgi:hypothetical protein